MIPASSPSRSYPDLPTLCQRLRAVAEAEILPRFRKRVGHHKADGSLVTAADIGVQQALAEELRQWFPGLAFLGEEMDAKTQQRQLAEAADTGIWCLDPLDGTSNYVGGFPYFGISLALLQGDKTRLGVVYDPLRQECFHAEYGGGAWLNGLPLRLESTTTDLEDCLALIDLKRLSAQDLTRLGATAPYRSQRNLGSVALDWCWLAAGRGQLYWHGGQKLWDLAAGRLIASEAGIASRLFTPEGQEPPPAWSLAPRLAVAAATEPLLKQWLRWLELPRIR